MYITKKDSKSLFKVLGIKTVSKLNITLPKTTTYSAKYNNFDKMRNKIYLMRCKKVMRMVIGNKNFFPWPYFYTFFTSIWYQKKYYASKSLGIILFQMEVCSRVGQYSLRGRGVKDYGWHLIATTCDSSTVPIHSNIFYFKKKLINILNFLRR